MPKLHKLAPAVAAVAAALGASRSDALVIYDGFAYPVGTLAEITNDGTNNIYTGRTNPFGPTWHVAGSSGTDTITVTSPGLTGPAWLGGTGNSAEWAGPALDGNAARIEIGPFHGPGIGGLQQTVYYSLALNVTDVSVLNPSTAASGYIIAGFNTISGPQAGSPGVIGTRLLARQHPSDTTKFQIGMSKNSNQGFEVIWDPAVLDVNATHFVVGSYTLVGGGADFNDLSRLWLNPSSSTFGAPEGSLPGPSIENSQGADLSINQIESFLFRQSGPLASGPSNTGIRVDELRVDTTWAGVAPAEPNAWLGGNGVWSNPAKWSTGAAPNAAGKFVLFDASVTATDITLDSSHTAGTLHFKGTNPYTINAGAGATLTLDGSSSIVVHQGDHYLNAPVTTGGNLTITSATGSSIAITGALTMPAGSRLIKSGYGEAVVKSVNTGRLDIFGGTVRLSPDSSPAGVSVVDVLNIPTMREQDVVRPDGNTYDPGPRGKLDLARNKLIVRNGVAGTASGGTYSGIQGLVQKGRNGGAWNGTGIVTSQDTQNGLTSIGVGTGAQIANLGPTQTATFAGQTITANSVVLMYTYGGDANLDGLVSGDDYTAIDFNILVPGADGWVNGDFNYDGIISGDDYTVIDFNILAQGAPFPVGGTGADGLTAVPEPGGACLLALSTAGFLAARRRKP